jgi:hypothetical protein
MRATILKTPENASAFATRERRSLPGIRQAEDVENKDAAKRLRSVEKEEGGVTPK